MFIFILYLFLVLDNFIALSTLPRMLGPSETCYCFFPAQSVLCSHVSYATSHRCHPTDISPGGLQAKTSWEALMPGRDAWERWAALPGERAP